MRQRYEAGEPARRQKRIAAFEEEMREAEKSEGTAASSLSGLKRAPRLASWHDSHDEPGGASLGRGSAGEHGEATSLTASKEREAAPPPPLPNLRPINRGDYEEDEVAMTREEVERQVLACRREELLSGPRQPPALREPEMGEQTTFSGMRRQEVGGGMAQEDRISSSSRRQGTSVPHGDVVDDEDLLFSDARVGGDHTATLGEGRQRRRRVPPPLTRTQEMELEAKKLEYYYGTPEYPALLDAFRRKYAGEEEEAEAADHGGAGGDAKTTTKKQKDREKLYTPEEINRGLAAQPIDYLRSSSKLQMQLNEGPRGYDPITMLQRQGLMRFQGYAFPPSTELGKLRLGDAKGVGEEEWDRVVERTHRRSPRDLVRKAFYSLLGREDPRHDHLAPAPSELEKGAREDRSLAFRLTGLDVTQRRQMRYMLTDFDYGDRQTAFHVMMTYPYTDWIHVCLMVAVGMALYYLQIQVNAYEFYDEYLGLDLRQAPSAKKPVIAGLTTMVMVFVLFQPLLVVSIGITRAYRIIRRRPIGPP